MAQPGPKTSWEDLAHLGWSQQQVYNTLNPLRYYTMHGLGDLHLNDVIFPFNSSYNVTKGDPSSVAAENRQVTSEPIPVWEYDNSNGSEPYTTVWTDKWSTTSTASLTLTRGPSINLQWSATIESVADSGFTISMSNDTSEIIEEESTDNLERTFEITVPAGETLEILRTESTTKGQSIYILKYGLNEGNDTIPGASIATTGDPYDGIRNWAFDLNTVLDYPGSKMLFIGLSQSSTFSHEFVRNGDTQKASNPVVKVVKSAGKKTAVQYAFPVAIEKSTEGHK
ncbi:hypothetical protein EDD18DRAFT_1179770 [Armillaria luteobubalina]|uniref:Uncharacterized protein n=1 Tax=Armillaria luteobubalina TaxID=153913 RepID=A0AA39ULU2_9AGAR|nr:hypothetical protein EDD18DRAFT_1179765 [Armillaria luteobubalina]KAK0493364.1 hypothetical protein EDD18DRAFT_1179770 [Armillaria luteobubalina]